MEMCFLLKKVRNAGGRHACSFDSSNAENLSEPLDNCRDQICVSDNVGAITIAEWIISSWEGGEPMTIMSPRLLVVSWKWQRHNQYHGCKIIDANSQIQAPELPGDLILYDIVHRSKCMDSVPDRKSVV